MNFLQVLADQLQTAAGRLERREGSPGQRAIYLAWSRHLMEDRRSIILLSETWREPVEVAPK